MYSNEPSNGPAPAAGYIPYFYHAGLYVRYAVSAGGGSERPYGRARSSYDFSSDSAFAPHPDRIQTVEQVIASGYFAVPRGDPVTAIISDKMHVSRLGLDDVIGQVRHRYEIYHQNMEELSQAVCETHNALFRQMADHGQLVANQRQQYSASKAVQKIYDMQREERVNLWRDVSRLRLALPETAQMYLTAHRKLSLLQAPPGDSP